MELFGFEVRNEDEYNWALYRASTETVIVIPKKGEVLSVTVMMGVLDQLRMDNATFFSLFSRASQ